ncbi:MAG: lysophospholipid acyltransferase family protein [Flavobacteriales bacterium]
MKKIRNIFKVALAFLLILIFGAVGAILRVISFGALTNFNRTVWIPLFCKVSLFCMGIRVKNNVHWTATNQAHFITFNHNSYLDGFVLMSLGIPNIRILMSERMLIFLPVWLISFSIGLLYIPVKEQAKRRLNFFYKLEKIIFKERIHILGSSEGVHVYSQKIAPFNRGVYHMALNCQMPILPLFIYTPEESNPYANFRPFKRGTVVIESMDPIDTGHWKLDDLDQHVAEVRAKYVQRFNEYYQVHTE